MTAQVIYPDAFHRKLCAETQPAEPPAPSVLPSWDRTAIAMARRVSDWARRAGTVEAARTALSTLTSLHEAFPVPVIDELRLEMAARYGRLQRRQRGDRLLGFLEGA